MIQTCFSSFSNWFPQKDQKTLLFLIAVYVIVYDSNRSKTFPPVYIFPLERRNLYELCKFIVILMDS